MLDIEDTKQTEQSFQSIDESLTLVTPFNGYRIPWYSFRMGLGKLLFERITQLDCRVWVNDVLLSMVVQYHPQIKKHISAVCTETSWVHVLGFHPSQSYKGVYIDGNERADIVDYHQLYL